MQTILNVWWDLESFDKKVWPVDTFFAVETILRVWGDLESFDKKSMPSYTRFFAVETILSLWGDLESFDKKMWPVTHFVRSADYLKFLRGLGKFRQKDLTSYTFFSLWRLTWVFEGTWKNFHKKVCPVTRFFAVETILSLWGDLESFDKKVWPVTRFVAVETILRVWGDLESFDKKIWPVTHFLRSADYLKFLMGLWKFFRQKGVTSYTFFSQCRLS